jgi:hypothetical protein
MPEGRTWGTAFEQEDWLRMKGNILGYITEVLANRLRAEFPRLPAQVIHLMFGYITPVAAEYVRRAIWRDTTLSEYEKAQLHIFTLRAYAYVIGHYRGHLPNAERCINEMPALMPLSDPSFFTRMHQVTPIFDEYFLPENRGDNLDDDIVFGIAFLHQVWGIVKERSDTVLNIDDLDGTSIAKAFDMTGRTIRQMIAD